MLSLMNKKQHLYGSFLTLIAFGLVAYYSNVIDNVKWYPYGFWILLVPLISLYPDIDTETSRHRRWFHNVFLAIVLVIIIPHGFKMPFVLAYVSHIMLDIVTPQGIALFWPVTSKFYGGLGVKPSGMAGTFVTVFISIALGIVIALLCFLYYSYINDFLAPL